MSVQDYMRGKEKAYLTKNQAKVDWLKNGTALGLTNKAFATYYNAWQGLGKVTQSMRHKIETDLIDTARTGSGYIMYEGDLEAVFKHIYNHNGSWESDWGSNYCGPQTVGAIALPVGVTNFLNAVDKRADNLKTNYDNYAKYAVKLVEAAKNNQWSKIGEVTEKMEKILWWGTPFIWVSSQNTIESNANYHDRLSKFTEGFGMLHTFINNYNSYHYGVGTSKTQALAISFVATFIKKGVPFIGDAYAKLFEVLPGVIKWARGIRAEQDRQIGAILGSSAW